MIFVCYRRADSQWQTDTLCRRLRTVFGDRNVIRDIDDTPIGEHWPDHLDRRIRECPVFLVVMGDRWAEILDPAADPPNRRLDDPSDTIRRELAAASASPARVIPVSVGIRWPAPHELPSEVRWVLDRNGVVLRPEPELDTGIGQLVAAIQPYVHSAPTAPPAAEALPGDVIPPAIVRAFAENVWRAYPSYEPISAGVDDPRRIYIELSCETQHDGAALAPALEFLRTGLEDGKAQLLLANFGMGKSFIARHLQNALLDAYERDPSRSRVPIVFPLKDLHLPRNNSDAVVDSLRLFAARHGLPVGDHESFRRQLNAGRLCVIFEALDELGLVSSDDEPRHMRGLLHQLDLRRYGDCPWVVTSRTGLFTTLLPEIRRERPYRVAVLVGWKSEDWVAYVQRCYELELVGSNEDRDRFLRKVENTPALRQLTNTPLLARMMVESWRDIVASKVELNRIRLYACYARYVLDAKRSASALTQLSSRLQCLESAAAFLFPRKRSDLTRDELVEVAFKYLEDVERLNLLSFVVGELQTYSLLVCDALTGKLGFSHRSFYEYFLALAVGRQTRRRGWHAGELLAAARLDSGEADFFGQWLAEDDQAELRRSLCADLRDLSSIAEPYRKRNLVAVAAATSRALPPPGRPDFLPLASADLAGVDVSGLDLSDCNLEACNLGGGTAVGTNFTSTLLRDANLAGCNLAGAVFDAADLSHARLDGATVTRLDSTTRRPKVVGASFRGIVVGATDAAVLLSWVESTSGDSTWRATAHESIARGTRARVIS